MAKTKTTITTKKAHSATAHKSVAPVIDTPVFQDLPADDPNAELAEEKPDSGDDSMPGW